MMKHLLDSMTREVEPYDIEYLLEKQDPAAAPEEMPCSGDVKIPAVKLFQELGKLFDEELQDAMQ